MSCFFKKQRSWHRQCFSEWNTSEDDSLIISCGLPEQGDGCEPRGGGLSWLRQGPYEDVWGWGWIGWSQSTKEARDDPNATCHIIIDTGGRTRHSDSASMGEEKLPICKQDCLPLHSAARRESSARRCVSELNCGFARFCKSCGVSMAVLWVMDRWHRHKRGGGILPRDFSPFICWVHDAELRRATEQGYANTPRINHNAGVKLIQTLYFWFTAQSLACFF